MVVGTRGQTDPGAVYLFARNGSEWTQAQKLLASNGEDGDGFGVRLHMSDDESCLVVSGIHEAGPTNALPGAGAVYVFEKRGAEWMENAILRAAQVSQDAIFGAGLALRNGCQELAVTAIEPDPAAPGGATYVFSQSQGSWTPPTVVRLPDVSPGDSFGVAATFRGGDAMWIGAPREGSSGMGLQLESGDEGAPDSGAVFIVQRDDEGWRQRGRLKAPNAGMNDSFGETLALSGDQRLLVVGASLESSNGSDGPSNDSIFGAGAVYVYRLDGSQ